MSDKETHHLGKEKTKNQIQRKINITKNITLINQTEKITMQRKPASIDGISTERDTEMTHALTEETVYKTQGQSNIEIKEK
jgi:hypothetical protein